MVKFAKYLDGFKIFVKKNLLLILLVILLILGIFIFMKYRRIQEGASKIHKLILSTSLDKDDRDIYLNVGDSITFTNNDNVSFSKQPLIIEGIEGNVLGYKYESEDQDYSSSYTKILDFSGVYSFRSVINFGKKKGKVIEGTITVDGEDSRDKSIKDGQDMGEIVPCKEKNGERKCGFDKVIRWRPDMTMDERIITINRGDYVKFLNIDNTGLDTNSEDFEDKKITMNDNHITIYGIYGSAKRYNQQFFSSTYGTGNETYYAIGFGKSGIYEFKSTKRKDMDGIIIVKDEKLMKCTKGKKGKKCKKQRKKDKKKEKEIIAKFKSKFEKNNKGSRKGKKGKKGTKKKKGKKSKKRTRRNRR